MLEQARQGQLVHSAVFTLDKQAQADQVCARVCVRTHIVACALIRVRGTFASANRLMSITSPTPRATPSDSQTFYLSLSLSLSLSLFLCLPLSHSNPRFPRISPNLSPPHVCRTLTWRRRSTASRWQLKVSTHKHTSSHGHAAPTRME